MFKITQNKGFQMTFKNGMTISVQFGVGNYCGQRNLEKNRWSEIAKTNNIVESDTAEIVIWDKEGTWLSFGSDTVKGWCDTDEVASWIIITTAATDINDLKRRVTECGMIGIQND